MRKDRMQEKIRFETEDGPAEFYVLEETRVNGRNYLLVTDSEEEEAQAYILKDMSESSEAEAVYEIVEEEAELESVSRIFSELLEDVTLM